MSKSSTVTVRETPVEKVASATAGGLVIHGENFIIDTDDRIELVDLTDRVMTYVRQFNIREGMITLWSMHTTCAVFINEFQKALLVDIKKFLEEMVARDRYYMHNDPDHSDCDRMNADSHLRAMLLGHSLTLQISGGEVVGEHRVLFLGAHERFEIAHAAADRGLFAEGALLAAKWLVGKPARLYTMNDVLGGCKRIHIRTRIRQQASLVLFIEPPNVGLPKCAHSCLR